MKKSFISVQTITVSALFIALGVILSFFKIPLSTVTELTFTGVPIAVGAYMFGPAVGFIIAALIDVCGFLIKPMGTFFPGFTISAGLAGMIYGLMLYCKWWQNSEGRKGFLRFGNTGLAVRVVLAHLLKTVSISLCLNCIWLSLYFGMEFKVVFIASLPKELINFPFEAFLIYSIIRVIMRIQPMKEMPYEKQ